jgi:hypothetical protein
MLRCGQGGSEAVIVLLRPFPLRARANVVFGEPGRETQFEATVAPPWYGNSWGQQMPQTLINVSWQALNNLFIRVEDGQTTIRAWLHWWAYNLYSSY